MAHHFLTAPLSHKSSAAHGGRLPDPDVMLLIHCNVCPDSRGGGANTEPRVSVLAQGEEPRPTRKYNLGLNYLFIYSPERRRFQGLFPLRSLPSLRLQSKGGDWQFYDLSGIKAAANPQTRPFEPSILHKHPCTDPPLQPQRGGAL